MSEKSEQFISVHSSHAQPDCASHLDFHHYKCIKTAMKQRYDLIAKAYNIALSPEKYDELVQIWDSYLGALEEDLPAEICSQPSTRDAFVDEELSHHFAQAALILQNLSRDDWQTEPANLIAGDERASLILAQDGQVVASNSKPDDLFHKIGHIRDLESKLRAGDYARLCQTLSQGTQNSEAMVPTVILCETEHGELSHFVVVPAELGSSKAGQQKQQFFILRSLEPRWSQELQKVLMSVFDLTARECEIVEGWCNSLSIADLAKHHNRSVQTVRTQVKTVLSKTGTGSQTALMRLVSGLSSLFTSNDKSVGDNTGIDALKIAVKQPDGRNIDVHLYGPEGGKPVLMLHGMLGGMAISPHMIEGLCQYNIRLILPVRPGFGKSDPIKIRETAPRQFAKDLSHILNYLGYKSVSVVGLMAGTLYAFAFASLFSASVDRIVNVSGCIPINSRRQFLLMRPRQSVIALTARYAPSMLPMLVDGGISQIRAGLAMQFLQALYKDTPKDLEIVQDKHIFPLLQTGLRYTVEQGATAFVTDSAHVTRNWSEFVDQIEQPVLYIHGACDPVVPIETIRSFAESRKNVQLQELAGEGQLFIYKKPELLFEALRE